MDKSAEGGRAELHDDEQVVAEFLERVSSLDLLNFPEDGTD